MEKFNIQSDGTGKRLDVFLQKKLDLTRSRIKTLIDTDNVLLNGKKQKAGVVLKAGDTIEVEVPETEKIDMMADESVEFEIVYEDDDLLVINKPQGLVVHPCQTTKDKTLVNGLMARVKNLSGINGELRPGIVHRLDKNTSGLMLVAKNDKAHVDLSKQIETKACVRKYFALLEGNVKEDEQVIETYIARDKNDRKKMAVNLNGEGKKATSICRVIERFGDYTFCEFQLKTGRTHQIRVHSKFINHSVVGDYVYGKKDKNLVGQLLHSHYIEFTQPTTKQVLSFSSDLPDYFEGFLRKIKSMGKS